MTKDLFIKKGNLYFFRLIMRINGASILYIHYKTCIYPT